MLKEVSSNTCFIGQLYVGTEAIGIWERQKWSWNAQGCKAFYWVSQNINGTIYGSEVKVGVFSLMQCLLGLSLHLRSTLFNIPLWVTESLAFPLFCLLCSVPRVLETHFECSTSWNSQLVLTQHRVETAISQSIKNFLYHTVDYVSWKETTAMTSNGHSDSYTPCLLLSGCILAMR